MPSSAAEATSWQLRRLLSWRSLAALASDVGDMLGYGQPGQPRLDNQVSPGMRVSLDPDQMFRVLSNLLRNAGQALAVHANLQQRSPCDIAVPQHDVARVAAHQATEIRIGFRLAAQEIKERRAVGAVRRLQILPGYAQLFGRHRPIVGMRMAR